MAELYVVLKWLHVLLVMIAVGINTSYGVLTARASREPEHLLFTLRTIRFLDNRVANPCYVLAFVLGVGLVQMGGWGFGSYWVAASIALFALVAALGLGAVSPALSKQIALVEAGDLAGASLLAGRVRNLGLAIMIAVVYIVYLMVAKPVGPLG